MSLSFWCRDYIFYPIAMSKFFGKLGKNLRSVFGDRVGKLVPIIIAQYATFITIGLWHGADFRFIAYGLYNGTIIVLSLLLEPYFSKAIKALHINTQSKLWKGFCIIRTFFIVVCGRVFPRAASFSVAITMFFSMFKFNRGVPFSETILSLGLTDVDFLIIIVACIVWFVVSYIEETRGQLRDVLDTKPLALRWAILLLCFAAVVALGIYGPGYDASAFIYRGF